MPKKVAIVGGGVSGSCAANYLISLGSIECGIDVVIFDQGGRGPGGRSSHRRISCSGKRSLSFDLDDILCEIQPRWSLIQLFHS